MDTTTVSSKALLAAMRISELSEASQKVILGQVNALLEEATKGAARSAASDSIRRKTTAARELSDEIYAILRDARIAKHTIGNLTDEYFDNADDDTAEGRQTLAINFKRAQMQANILLDYVCKVVDSLSVLDADASIISPQEDIKRDFFISSVRNGLLVPKNLTSISCAAKLFSEIPEHLQSELLGVLRSFVLENEDLPPKSLIAKLDQINFQAVFRLLVYLICGDPNEMAFAACNSVLKMYGRKPLKNSFVTNEVALDNVVEQ